MLDDIMVLQKKWESIKIANLFDTLDALGYPDQCIDLGIKPLITDRQVAGMAITVRGGRTPYNETELKEFKKNMDFEHLLPLVYPGSIIIVDGGGEPYTGKFGEMTSWALKQRGATGIVIDGFIRDLPGLVQIPDYIACARGTSPIESDKRWAIHELNVPIALPGTLSSFVRIAPGDWVVGGPDGVMVVPKEISDLVLEKALDIEIREEGMRRDLATGMSFEEAFKIWGRA